MAEQGSNDTVEMTENSDFVICKSSLLFKLSPRGLYALLLAVGSVLDDIYFKVSGRSPKTT